MLHHCPELPADLRHGPGSEIRKPLAAVVISTTLFTLPTLGKISGRKAAPSLRR